MREEIKQAILKTNESFWSDSNTEIEEITKEDEELYDYHLELAVTEIIQIIMNKIVANK